MLSTIDAAHALGELSTLSEDYCALASIMVHTNESKLSKHGNQRNKKTQLQDVNKSCSEAKN
ncbi:MAG: hypothetical protein CL912_18420 [Deltaproteobacteria bacterium]|nr:hypothetical protein [Deltaproteobacteria bacterium]